jgi:hypothetical protein
VRKKSGKRGLSHAEIDVKKAIVVDRSFASTEKSVPVLNCFSTVSASAIVGVTMIPRSIA